MKILHLIDSLNAGGAERMAVTYANALLPLVDEVHLWATREEGILKKTLMSGVKYHCLNRKGPIGIVALYKASKLIKKEDVQILHAHSTSFFFATLLKWLNPSLKLVWHDHYGKSEELNNRKFGMLKFCSTYFDLIISVNKQLETWAIDNLNCKEVIYINNFSFIDSHFKSKLRLNGVNEKRIVCLANLRPQKNHLNLLNAFVNISETYPEWTLHLLGKNWNDELFRSINMFIHTHALENKVFYYDSQEGILSVLKQVDIGVLSSDSEGLPLALLEYGIAGLAVVTTDVGHCKEVVQDFGKVVPPKNPEALAEALIAYMEDPGLRKTDAAAFQKHIQQNYTEDAVIPKVMEIYQKVLGGRK